MWKNLFLLLKEEELEFVDWPVELSVILCKGDDGISTITGLINPSKWTKQTLVKLVDMIEKKSLILQTVRAAPHRDVSIAGSFIGSQPWEQPLARPDRADSYANADNSMSQYSAPQHQMNNGLSYMHSQPTQLPHSQGNNSEYNRWRGIEDGRWRREGSYTQYPQQHSSGQQYYTPHTSSLPEHLYD